MDTKPVMQAGNMTAHTALFLLMLSGLFGNLSSEASASDRLVTWLAIVISGVVATGLLASIV